MRYRMRSSFSYGSMWMSLAPLEMADISITLTSRMTGASSPCRASASTLISSSSSSTSTSEASTSGRSCSAWLAKSSALGWPLPLFPFRVARL